MTMVRPSGGAFPPLTPKAQLRWDVVRPIVRRVRPATTIEIGTGQGAMGARLAALTTDSYVGFETDRASSDRAGARVEPYGGIVHNSMVGVVSPPPADLVCAFEVLEHIEDDAAALAEWTDYVVPGGYILLSVPAHPERFGPMDEYAGHFRRYSSEAIAELFESVGLVDVDAKFYGLPLGYALEAVRNRIDAKKLARDRDLPVEELTAASGRTFQFGDRSWKSTVSTVGTAPFVYLQRIWRGGVGLVILASKPR